MNHGGNEHDMEDIISFDQNEFPSGNEDPDQYVPPSVPLQRTSSPSSSDSDEKTTNEKMIDSDYESLPPFQNNPSSSTDSDESTSSVPDSPSIRVESNENEY